MDLLQEIDLDKIVVQSPRRNSETDLNSLIRLRQSIDEIGVVEPILVQQDENGNYPLISCERRVQACRDLGFKTKQMEKKNISFEGNERDLWLREIDALRTFAVP